MPMPMPVRSETQPEHRATAALLLAIAADAA